MAYCILHVKTKFTATRALRHYEGPCSKSEKKDFIIESRIITPEPDAQSGMHIDLYDLKNRLDEITKKVENKDLHVEPPFDKVNPTNENLAKFFLNALQTSLENFGVRVMQISVWENENLGVSYVSNLK